MSAPSAATACAQSIVSATPGGLYRSRSRSAATAAATCRRERFGDLGGSDAQDGELALEVGVVDPVVQAAALQRVVDVAGAVRGDDHDGGPLRPEGAELGDGDRVVGEDLEEERLELVVGAVHLVDEQHRRDGTVGGDGAQKRSSDEELLGVELVLAGRLAACLLGSEVEQLAGVVPLVHGLRRVDALVALQAHQLPAGPVGEDLRQLGLPDARLAFEQQGPLQGDGEEHGGGEPRVGEVVVCRQRGAARPPPSRPSCSQRNRGGVHA